MTLFKLQVLDLKALLKIPIYFIILTLIVLFLYSVFRVKTPWISHFQTSVKSQINIIKSNSYFDSPWTSQIKIKNVTLEPTYSYNMHFIETNIHRINFTRRQLCSIESAAFTNPKAQVNVFSVNAKLDEYILKAYPNVKLIAYEIKELFKDTPYENWSDADYDKLFKGQFFYAHLSDLSRIILLWKYGGYYADLDTITLKSVQSILKFNGAAIQKDPVDLSNFNLIFAKNHSFLFDVMNLTARSYDPSDWTLNGARNLRKIAEKRCKVPLDKLICDFDSPQQNNNVSNKCDFNLFPTKYFTPVTWQNWKQLFDSNSSIPVSRFFHLYSIHFFTKMSDNFDINKNHYSIYDYYSKHYCPLTYDLLFKMKNKQKVRLTQSIN